MKLVADSSYMRAPELEVFLRATVNNIVVLTEVTAFEAYKGNPLKNAFYTSRICHRYAGQVLVLKGTGAIIELESRRSISRDDYVDSTQTADFARYCSLIAHAANGNTELQTQIEEHGKAAAEKMASVRGGVDQVVAGVRGLAQAFSDIELRELRAGRSLSQTTLQKVAHGMLESAAWSFGSNPGVTEFPALNNAADTFLFRYGVASYALALWWIRNGDIANAPVDLLCNDVIDMQQVALASRFDGLLTRDTKMREIFDEATMYMSVFAQGVLA